MICAQMWEGASQGIGSVQCSAFSPSKTCTALFYPENGKERTGGLCWIVCSSSPKPARDLLENPEEEKAQSNTSSCCGGLCGHSQSPGEHMSPSTQSPFSLQRAFVSLKGSKAMTNLTTIILQKTHRLFSSFLLQCFLTSVSVLSNTASVLK